MESLIFVIDHDGLQDPLKLTDSNIDPIVETIADGVMSSYPAHGGILIILDSIKKN
ncbi:MAG TPA: hypothetical protein VD815_04435 [Candidatus Saccharimonadales bacterium]|nr:hypothetical protein [Candidatus Saccharimonadales bacterium]